MGPPKPRLQELRLLALHNAIWITAWDRPTVSPWSYNDWLEYWPAGVDFDWSKQVDWEKDIVLTTNGVNEKLAISLAMSQSVRMELFEEAVDETVRKVQQIPREMAKSGSNSTFLSSTFLSSVLKSNPLTKFSDGLLVKRFAEVHTAIIDVNLVHDFLDVPDIFWVDDKWQRLWRRFYHYFEIKERIEILNKRFACLQELLEILNADRKHMQEDRLTIVIIIILILQVAALAIRSFIERKDE